MDPDAVAPQAARPCNPFQSNLRANAAYSGFSWYLGDDPMAPEAASFGDALAQLDVFLRQLNVPFVLAGKGQGAALALTLAAYSPKGLAGVFAPGASLPRIAGWAAPAAGPAAAPIVTQENIHAASWMQSLTHAHRNSTLA